MTKPSSANILVIDNDEDVLRGITRRLESAGYNCQTANSGAQGLSTFSHGGIDLIITDLNMPALNGVEMIKKIRQFNDVPIIVITGFRAEYNAQINNLHGVIVMQKPFDSQHLIDLVIAQLASSRRCA